MEKVNCVVVSSNKKLIGQGLGSWIDSHYIIFRMNHFKPIFPEDIGTKTTIHVNGQLSQLPTFLDKTIEFINVNNPSSKHFLDEKEGEEIINFIKDELKIEWKNGRYKDDEENFNVFSTGFFTILIQIVRYKKINIAGFYDNQDGYQNMFTNSFNNNKTQTMNFAFENRLKHQLKLKGYIVEMK